MVAVGMTLKSGALILLAAVSLSSCEKRNGIPTDAPTTVASKAASPLSVDADVAEVCRSIRDVSDGGKGSLELAVYGQAVERSSRDKVTLAHVQGEVFRYTGVELNSGSCWAYGELVSPNEASRVVTTWRCPVSIIRDDQQKIGTTILEEVNTSSCEYGAVRGTDARIVAASEIQRLQF